MELKVKVGGILRVVCGVTEITTCQEVVVALAHAMGKTGRFTLVEQWRENERLLLPKDCPVQILQKWGEYASEVQFLLKQSDEVKGESSEIGPTEGDKLKPQLTSNNVAPPRGGHTSVHRSLTFSGAHNVASNPLAIQRLRTQQARLDKAHSLDQEPSYNPKMKQHDSIQTSQLPGHYKNYSQPPEASGLPIQRNNIRRSPLTNNNSNMIQETRKSPFQSDAVLQNQNYNFNVQPQHRKEHNRVTSPGGRKIVTSPSGRQIDVSGGFNNRLPSPRQPPVGHNHVHPDTKPSAAGQLNNYGEILTQNLTSRPSAFQPVIPHNRQHSKDTVDLTQSSGVTVPGYSPPPSITMATDAEEYDLDSNFPDILRDSRSDSRKENLLIEEYRMPGDEGSTQEVIDPEVIKMKRLVAKQKERIHMQENQLHLIETELVTLEDKDRQILDQQHSIGEEIVKLQQQYNENEAEIVQLDAVKWVDVIETEKSKEKQYRGEMSSLKVKMDTFDGQLKDNQSKIQNLNSEITKEQSDLSQILIEEQDKEEKVQQDIKQVQQQLEEKLEQFETEKSCLCTVEEEMNQVNKNMDSKKEEIETLEKDMKNVNLQSFETSGEGKAFLKTLEGRQSPGVGLGGRRFVTSPLSKVLSVSKNPNGVWV